MYTALSDFFKNEVYDINYKTEAVKIKYKSLHDLAMFIHNYESKKNKSNIDLENIEINRMYELKKLRESLSLPKIQAKKKTRKKKTELEGQTSFFD